MLPVIKLIFILLFISAPVAVNAQDKFPFEWNGRTFIDSLEAAGITKIISYKDYYPGSEVIFEEGQPQCDPETEYYDLYIFWQDAEATMAKSFNNCYQYRTAEIGKDSLFPFVWNNLANFKSEQLRINKRKEKQKSIILEVHTDLTDIAIRNGSTAVLYHFDASEIANNPKVYQDYSNSKLFQLNSLCNTYIKNYHLLLKGG